MKPRVTTTAYLAAQWVGLAIFVFVLILISLGIQGLIRNLYFHQDFSPPEPGANHPVLSADAPAFISCLELQCELNRRNPKLKLAEDGICGPATMAAWDAEINDRYAISLWPE